MFGPRVLAHERLRLRFVNAAMMVMMMKMHILVCAEKKLENEN